jgi:ubiquinone/menaquinone biosynthesis C-methylase UbiE
MSEELKYLEFGSSLVGFSDKDVLEVGGCVTPELIASFCPKSWTSIDINPRRFEGKDASHREFFSHRQMSVTNLEFPDNSFDRVFSVNCFEHVDDMAKAFSEMQRVLRPGGILFTIFGPIWSSPVGHHTWVEHDGILYHFGKQVFPDWYHLTKSRDELFGFLEEKYDKEVANKICKYVYESSDLNRLTDGDFLRLLEESDLKKRLIINNRKGDKKALKSEGLIEEIKTHYPSCRDPRVTEILLVASKGRIDLGSHVKIYSGLISEILKKVSKKIG